MKPMIAEILQPLVGEFKTRTIRARNSNMSKIIPQTYTRLLTEIKDRIRTAQYAALKAVNKELIALYWDIGKMIVERQKGETWGKSVVEQLSKDLCEEFPEIKGFSSTNLWYMRKFYLAYYENKKLPQFGGRNWLVAQSCYFGQMQRRPRTRILYQNDEEIRLVEKYFDSPD